MITIYSMCINIFVCNLISGSKKLSTHKVASNIIQPIIGTSNIFSSNAYLCAFKYHMYRPYDSDSFLSHKKPGGGISFNTLPILNAYFYRLLTTYLVQG